MTRTEEIAMQEEYLKTHQIQKTKKTVHYRPGQPKKKKAKKIKKSTSKKVNKDYLIALKKNKRGLITNITKPEKTFKDFLDVLEINYSFQRIFTVGKRKGYIVDFYLVDYLTIVEIDGNHHNEKGQDKKDNERTTALLKLKGINHIIRFDNEDILSMSINDIKRYLAIKLCPFVEDLL